MKLPSFSYLAGNARRSLLRFPLTVFSSLVSVVTAIILIESADDSMFNHLPYVNLILVAGLGIPAFFCISILAEMQKIHATGVRLLHLGVLAILVVLYYSLPDAETTFVRSAPYIRYAFYNIAVHLTVSFIPFLRGRGYNGFWQYNKALFIRFLTSGLYSGVLTLGIFAAMFALDQLFDVHFDGRTYPEIFIVFGGLFNTWFFVSGIPEDFEELEKSESYPKGLRIFCQYVLLPLLTVYLLILYSYGSKIIVTGDWPRGIVSYLIIWVSVAGIFLFLLLYPYGKLAGNEWMRKAARLYYYLLFPLLLLLFTAILMRIDDYGITVNRYIILVLGIWLTAVSLYTSAGRTNIKFIPSSLAIMLLLISFGPWGVFSVSERYQVKRLRAIFENSGIMKDGKIQRGPAIVKDSSGGQVVFADTANDRLLNDSLRTEVVSILEYLDAHHGFSAINSWYPGNMDSLVHKQAKAEGRRQNLDEAEFYLHAAGLSSVYENTLYLPSRVYTLDGSPNIIKTKGYHYSIANLSQYSRLQDREIFGRYNVGGDSLLIRYSAQPEAAFIVRWKGGELPVGLSGFISSLEVIDENKRGALSDSILTVSAEAGGLAVAIRFSQISLAGEGKTVSIEQFQGDLLIGKTE